MSKDSVAITCDSDGLTFRRWDASGQAHVLHQISVSTLQQMSMTDLEYALLTNLLTELPALRAVFADYLWSADGQVPPLRERSAPRSPDGSTKQ